MEGSKSDVYMVSDCPIPDGTSNDHEGLDGLLDLMGDHGLMLYQTEGDARNGGKDGLIGKDDVVLIKVNAQWKYRGCTNADVTRGLIQRILDHPEGFAGEIVLFENGQDGGSLDCDTMWSNRYPDTGVHANAEDERYSFSYLVDSVFGDPRVSAYLLDPIREVFIPEDDHTTDGYRRLGEISYPCFTTAGGNRVELREGVWDGSEYRDNLKLVNLPVLKHHGGCGITGALKIYCGVLSMADGNRDLRHYDALGRHCGEMITRVRAPVLTVLDCIWVSLSALCGYPPETTRRLDTLVGGTDPVALDYWASKHLFYPIDGNEEHHPDRFPGLRDSLIQARDTINAGGGIFGQETVLGDERINVISRSL